MKALKAKMDGYIAQGTGYQQSFPNPGPIINAVKVAFEKSGAKYDHTVKLPVPFTGSMNLRDVGGSDKFMLLPIPEADMTINLNLGSNNPGW